MLNYLYAKRAVNLFSLTCIKRHTHAHAQTHNMSQNMDGKTVNRKIHILFTHYKRKVSKLRHKYNEITVWDMTLILSDKNKMIFSDV